MAVFNKRLKLKVFQEHIIAYITFELCKASQSLVIHHHLHVHNTVNLFAVTFLQYSAENIQHIQNKGNLHH